MKRLRLRVAYRGDLYHGWQLQPHCRTVQGALQEALAKLLNTQPDQVVLQGASRTDAGVHAEGQTIHIDHDTSRTPWDFVRGLNALTDDDICVFWAEELTIPFHARHDSRGKTYIYTLWNHRFAHPLHTKDAWHVRHPLRHVDKMQEAAQRLLGEHDFAAFRASDCQAATTLRTITKLEVTSPRPCTYELVVEGNAFLKYMVRILTGTLVAVGLGRFEPDVIDAMFAQKDRSLGGPTAPPHGLVLRAVHYPDHPWQTPNQKAPVLGGPWLPEDV